MTFEAICERLEELPLSAAEAQKIVLIAQTIRRRAARARRVAKLCPRRHPLTGPDAVVRFKRTTTKGKVYTYRVCLVCERADNRIPRSLHKRAGRKANVCACGHRKRFHTPECFHETASGKFDCDCTGYKRRA